MTDVAGIVRDTSGTPITGSTREVRCYVNGVDQGTDTTASGTGAYSFTGLTIVDTDIVHVFFDAETEKGVTVTISDGTNITGLDIRDDRLIIANDKAATTITNANIGLADSGDDADIIYSEAGGALTVDVGREVEIRTTDAFTPGGNVTMSEAGGSLVSLLILGTWNETSGDTLTVTNVEIDFTGGTYNAASGAAIVANATGSSDPAWTGAGATIQDLTINYGGSDSRFLLAGTLIVGGNLTVTDVFRMEDNGSGDLEVKGNVTWTAGGEVNTSHDLFIHFTGTGAQLLTYTAGTICPWKSDKASGTLTVDSNATLNDVQIMKPFIHIQGTVDFTTNTTRITLRAPAGGGSLNTFDVGSGLTFHQLFIDSDANTKVDGVATVNDEFSLVDGGLDFVNTRETDRIDCKADVTVEITGGAASSSHTCEVHITGTGAQAVYNKNGVFPSLVINKATGIAAMNDDGDFQMAGKYVQTSAAATVDWTTNTTKLHLVRQSGTSSFRDFNPNGAAFHQLQFDSVSTTQVSGTGIVNDTFICTQGDIEDAGSGLIQFKGDVTLAAAFGSVSVDHNCLLEAIGPGDKVMTITAGGKLPEFKMNKDAGIELVASGGVFETSTDLIMEQGVLIINSQNATINGVTIKGAGVSVFKVNTGGATRTIDFGSPSPAIDGLEVDDAGGGKVSFTKVFDMDATPVAAGGEPFVSGGMAGGICG